MDIQLKNINNSVTIAELIVKKHALGLYITDMDLIDAKVILTNDENEKMEFKCEKKNNFMYCEINLDELTYKNQILTSSIEVNGQNRDLVVAESVKLKEIRVENEEKIKNICVFTEKKSNGLILEINNEFTLNPTIESLSYENDKLILSGTLNSNMNINNRKNINSVIRLIAYDNSAVIEDEIKLKYDEFKYEISKNELYGLKDAYSGSWSVEVEVSLNEEITCARRFRYNMDEDINTFTQELLRDNENIMVSPYITKKGNVAIYIKNEVTISQILSMRVHKNDLTVKFRTKEKVTTLLDENNIKTNIKNTTEELVSKGIKKKGKKTYEAYYTSKDLKAFLDETLDKGITLVTKVNDKVFIQEMKEVNKYVIYYTMWDAVQNTRKYKKLCSVMYNKLFLKLPIKKKRVLFESFLGRNVSGNPKYIYNYMVEQGLDKKYDLVWILNDLGEEIIGNGKKVKRKSLKYYYYMATSAKWIFNVRQADEIVKREGITYLQTWHGTPLKRLASDMFNVDMGGVTNIDEYKEKFFRNTRRWDYLLAQNNYSAEIFTRAFNFHKEMIYGYPANDILYKNNNTEDINKLKDKFNIPKDKKVIIYAPTWREDNFYKKGHYKMSLELELDKMQKELGNEYIVLIRAHYLIANSINIADYKGFVYDFSQGYDIQELYIISDILITDYSSVMFDFGNLKRPMVFFTYDLEKYRDSLRGFYFDFKEDAPGPLVMTTEEVINSIKNIDEIIEEYKEKQKLFYDKFCHVDDGNSAKHVVDKIFFNK